MPIRTLIRVASIAVLASTAAACGDVVRSNRSPVIFVVNSLAGGTAAASFLLSDVVVETTTPDPCSATNPCLTVFNDPGTASLGVIMKDVTVAPSTNNSVTVTRYRVEFRRTDGRNTPGVDVPFPLEGGTTATITAGVTGSVGFELVRHTSKKESPLIQLRDNPNVISTIADVTFFGADQVGNDVSATGSILVNFGNFGDSQ